GQVLNAGWNVLSDPRLDDGSPDRQMKSFGLFLHQAVSELDLFGPSPASQRLAAIYSTIRLPLARNDAGQVTQDTDAATFLRGAMRVLIDATPQMVGLPASAAAPSVTMPLEWPQIDAQTGAALTNAALDCLSANHARRAPSEPRYDGD